MLCTRVKLLTNNDTAFNLMGDFLKEIVKYGLKDLMTLEEFAQPIVNVYCQQL